MGLPLVTMPGVYDFIVEYANGADRAQTWRNVWSMAAASPPEYGVGIIASLGGLSIALIHGDAVILSFKLYDWSKGTHPYPSGDPIWSHDSGAVGTADSYWPHLNTPYSATGGEVVLRGDLDADGTGRAGKKFFRGLLGIKDIISTTGGPWILEPSLAGLQSDYDAIWTASGLAGYLGGGSGGQRLVIPRYSPKTHTAMGTSNISSKPLIGVSTNRQTRKSHR